MFAPCILEIFLSPLPSYLTGSIDDKRTIILSCVSSAVFSLMGIISSLVGFSYLYTLPGASKVTSHKMRNPYTMHGVNEDPNA
jgi:hypothetical protein